MDVSNNCEDFTTGYEFDCIVGFWAVLLFIAAVLFFFLGMKWEKHLIHNNLIEIQLKESGEIKKQ